MFALKCSLQNICKVIKKQILITHSPTTLSQQLCSFWCMSFLQTMFLCLFYDTSITLYVQVNLLQGKYCEHYFVSPKFSKTLFQWLRTTPWNRGIALLFLSGRTFRSFVMFCYYKLSPNKCLRTCFLLLLFQCPFSLDVFVRAQ